jgi:hypothetical protein
LAKSISDEVYFGKASTCPCFLSRFISMYGRYLSDGHSNDISADFWRAIMNQDNKAQPQQAIKPTSQASRVSNPPKIRGSRRSSRPRSPARTRARAEFERTPPSGGVLAFRPLGRESFRDHGMGHQ